MAELIMFPMREDRIRAIDILAEAEETYHGVAPRCYLVSNAAVALLKSQNVRFQVVGEKDKETVHVAGS